MTLALHGNKITFDKVIKMIDAMVETLKKEQKNDDYKKEYCTMQLNLKDGKRKAVSRALSDAETAIESLKQLKATLHQGFGYICNRQRILVELKKGCATK